MEMKKRSHRYNISRLRSRRGVSSKYKMCHGNIMSTFMSAHIFKKLAQVRLIL